MGFLVDMAETCICLKPGRAIDPNREQREKKREGGRKEREKHKLIFKCALPSISRVLAGRNPEAPNTSTRTL